MDLAIPCLDEDLMCEFFQEKKETAQVHMIQISQQRYEIQLLSKVSVQKGEFQTYTEVIQHLILIIQMKKQLKIDQLHMEWDLAIDLLSHKFLVIQGQGNIHLQKINHLHTQ